MHFYLYTIYILHLYTIWDSLHFSDAVSLRWMQSPNWDTAFISTNSWRSMLAAALIKRTQTSQSNSSGNFQVILPEQTPRCCSQALNSQVNFPLLSFSEAFESKINIFCLISDSEMGQSASAIPFSAISALSVHYSAKLFHVGKLDFMQMGFERQKTWENELCVCFAWPRSTESHFTLGHMD